ncbi:hypothetical protein Sros01_72240 [Streptomyces roseochromogenus]|nr:hypothetical protein Sros01_72240 [Streptomyces roseochromogenus]
MRDTRGGREEETLRLRQIQGALRTLAGLGGGQQDQALVVMPKGAKGQWLYPSFWLMSEGGRGPHQSPNLYTVPADHWAAGATVGIPPAFFLNGWAQVLSPSEVATWLVLRVLSKWAPRAHATSGVFLYGENRKDTFGLRRDAWEDGCQRLREFGLIRFARPMLKEEGEAPSDANDWLLNFAEPAPRDRYEPHRYQVTEQGLEKDALKICHKELTLRQLVLNRAAKARAEESSQA